MGHRYGAVPFLQGRLDRSHARCGRPVAPSRPWLAGHSGGASDFYRVDSVDRGCADRGSRAARALSLHSDQVQLAIVDGVGSVVPHRARCAERALADRRMVGQAIGSVIAGVAGRRGGRARDVVYRVPVRAGAGARSVAGTLRRHSTWSRSRGWPDPRRCSSRRRLRGTPQPDRYSR